MAVLRSPQLVFHPILQSVFDDSDSKDELQSSPTSGGSDSEEEDESTSTHSEEEAEPLPPVSSVLKAHPHSETQHVQLPEDHQDGV